MVGDNKKAPWLNYLEWNVLLEEPAAGGRVTGISIKVDPSGMMGVVRAIRGDGPVVCFATARTLSGLSRNIRQKIAGEDTLWKPDKYYKFDEK